MTLRINLKWTVFAIYLLMIPFTASYYWHRRCESYETYRAKWEDSYSEHHIRSNYELGVFFQTIGASAAWPVYWTFRTSSLIWEE